MAVLHGWTQDQGPARDEEAGGQRITKGMKTQPLGFSGAGNSSFLGVHLYGSPCTGVHNIYRRPPLSRYKALTTGNMQRKSSEKNAGAWAESMWAHREARRAPPCAQTASCKRSTALTARFQGLQEAAKGSKPQTTWMVCAEPRDD